MITSTPLILALFVTFGQSVGPPPASQSSGRNYIQPSFLIWMQPAATANHRIDPPLGGHAVGLSVAAGRFVTPVIAFEGQFVFSGAVSSQQRFSYFWSEDYVGETRDILLNASVRVRPPEAQWVEFVLGGGLATVRSGQRDKTQTGGYPQRTTPLPDTVTTDYTPNIAGGVEFLVNAGPRAAIVPSFRVRWRSVSEADVYQGVGALAMQYGVGVRIVF